MGDDIFNYRITGEPSDKEFTAPEEQSRRFFVYRLGAGGRFYYRTEENPQQAFLHFRIAMGHHEASIHDLYVRLPNHYELINDVNTLIQGEYVPIDSASIATGVLLR